MMGQPCKMSAAQVIRARALDKIALHHIWNLTLLDSGGNSVGYFYIQYFVFSVPCLLLRLPDGLHWELVVKNQIEKDRLMWGHCTNSILTCNQLCPNQGATGISFFSEILVMSVVMLRKLRKRKSFYGRWLINLDLVCLDKDDPSLRSIVLGSRR